MTTTGKTTTAQETLEACKQALQKSLALIEAYQEQEFYLVERDGILHLDGEPLFYTS